jgi:predicted 3-demethylubiquinone-9 3-methyltransferase (glyoxalase superfamily)
MTAIRERSEAMQKLTPCLWFDTQGEEAAKLYTSIFPNSRITHVSHYGEAGPREAGSVLTVEFELDGQAFTALNGGPQYTFSEAISFQVSCADQAEVDHYWDSLGEGGEHGPCGWLKDRFGVSWQIVPRRLVELLEDPDREKASRVMSAMMKMGKLEIDELERAAA